MPKWKQFSQNLISALLGGLFVAAGLLYWQGRHNSPIAERPEPRLQDDDFFQMNRDPFQTFRAMEKQMLKQQESLQKQFGQTMSFSFSDQDISQREDEGAVYFDIATNGQPSTSINTKVDRGYLTIIGTVDQSLENDQAGTGQAMFKSTFRRTLPVPDNVDTSGMEMLREKDRIVLKFPKLSASKKDKGRFKEDENG